MKATPLIRSFIISFLLVILSIQYVTAQTSELNKERIYQAYVRGDLTLWKRAIEDIEKSISVGSNNDLLHQLVMDKDRSVGWVKEILYPKCLAKKTSSDRDRFDL